MAHRKLSTSSQGPPDTNSCLSPPAPPPLPLDLAQPSAVHSSQAVRWKSTLYPILPLLVRVRLIKKKSFQLSLQKEFSAGNWLNRYWRNRKAFGKHIKFCLWLAPGLRAWGPLWHEAAPALLGLSVLSTPLVLWPHWSPGSGKRHLPFSMVLSGRACLGPI